MRPVVAMLVAVWCVAIPLRNPACAAGMYFEPDTSFAQIGDTILFSAYMTASDTVRSFNVYMVYDTNDIDLVVAPAPGSLIAGRPGLDFRYNDHIPAAPNWLEVGATLFSTAYWAGPGELFTFGLVMRECGQVPISGSFSNRRPDGSFMPGTFSPPGLFVCTQLPLAPDSLTIFWNGTAAHLRWKEVILGTFGVPLPDPPRYVIYRAEEMPANVPFAPIDTVDVTEYLDSTGLGIEHIYYVKAIVE